MTEHKTDAVVAVVKLAGRAGATQFELAWDCPHVPDEEDGHNCPDVRWHCSVKYLGRRIFTESRQTPSEAAMDLAHQLLDGAMCRCNKTVDLAGDGHGCHWQLIDATWKPACNAEPFNMAGVARGDLVNMNRAARRRIKKRK